MTLIRHIKMLYNSFGFLYEEFLKSINECLASIWKIKYNPTGTSAFILLYFCLAGLKKIEIKQTAGNMFSGASLYLKYVICYK
jgi:hypothetical protein